MQLLKNLLNQKHLLDALRSQFASQPSLAQSQMDTLESALDYVDLKSLNYLAKELVKPRITDSCAIVRKCILDSFATFEQVELRQACDQKDMKFV